MNSAEVETAAGPVAHVPVRWPTPPNWLVVRGGDVYTPEHVGRADVLIAAGRFVAVGPALALPAGMEIEEIDASGCIVTPGFIDLHAHIIGGGGEGGPATRNPDIGLSNISRHGVTTIVGVLGVDSVSKSMESLLARARGLDVEGVTTYAWTGSYVLPPPTLTGDVTRDVAYVDKILGAKLAISDHRDSAPSPADIARMAAAARMGGLLGGKPGLLHLHVGQGKRALADVFEVIERTELPPRQFFPTHMNRAEGHLQQAFTLARLGGFFDVTAGVAPALGFPKAVKPSAALRTALGEGVFARATMSSDANGNMIVHGAGGGVESVVVQSIAHLHREWKDLVLLEGVPVETALRPVTTTAAEVLRLRHKGRIAPPCDGDVVVFDQDLTVRHVVSRGAVLVRDAEPVVLGTFENPMDRIDVVRNG